MHTIHRVAEFHRVFNHPIEQTPTTPTAKMRLLRFRLLFEEVMEFGRAIGIDGLACIPEDLFERHLKETLDDFRIDADAEVDLPLAADALGDIDYVCQGANLVFGFPAEDVSCEIHRANMSKLGANGEPIYDEHKKVVKGPNYTPPDVAAILKDFAARV
jgi:predicted HAD superfamily Cof-like phosphohydrolase